MYSDNSLKVYTFSPERKYLNRSLLYVSFYKNMSADTEIATEISKWIGSVRIELTNILFEVTVLTHHHFFLLNDFIWKFGQ